MAMAEMPPLRTSAATGIGEISLRFRQREKLARSTITIV